MSARKKLLLVCYGNMIRSQMAEGFACEMGDAFLDVYSAGVSPTGQVSQEAILVMREKGIDISRHHSKGFDEVPLFEMDYVVSLTDISAKTMCPPGFKGVVMDRMIRDPVGESIERYRTCRDEVERVVHEIVQQIWRGGAIDKD
jgi:arsenate reductase